jgi:hypothetical protein
VAGFFRELATRARAPRTTMHPISAAPYSAGTGPELPASAVWPDAAHASIPESPHDGADHEPAHLLPHAPAPAPARARSERAPHTPAAHFDASAPPPHPESLVPSPRRPALEPVRAHEAGATPAAQMRDTHGASAAQATVPMAPAPASVAPRARGAASAAPATPAAERIAAPLRPATAVNRQTLSTPRPARPQSRAAEQAAPEVHIHIGRIELTAAAAPPERPRRADTAQRKAMSLDDYLRRKSRRPT